MVTCEDEVTAAFAAETAVIVTVLGDGTVEGGVYSPELDTVPTVVSPPATPLTSQLTAVFAELATSAVKSCAPAPACTLEETGQTCTSIAGVVKLQPLDPDAVAGAVLDAEVGVITTSAVSVSPALSVTVKRTVEMRQLGAVTVGFAALAFWMESAAPLTLVQA